MQYLNRITGAVFFIDILGIGALTQNKIDLKFEDFDLWLSPLGLEHDNQTLAASILGEFRRILNDVNQQFPNVTIAQLSDCAFVWSEDISDIVVASNNLMSECISNGILCRGGLSFGEIIETTQNYDLGRFIVGQAATNAVKLEGIAKGARILMDQGFPIEFWEQNKDLRSRMEPMFQPFINPLDFITYDEYKWYLVPFISDDIEDLSVADTNYRLSLTKRRLKLASAVRHNEKYNWNSRSVQGLIQLKATINFMSEGGLLGIGHNFQWIDVTKQRSNNTQSHVAELIDNDEDYVDLKINNASAQQRI